MNSDGTISWPNFLRAIGVLAKNLEEWSLVTVDENVPGGIYLKYSMFYELSRNKPGRSGFKEQTFHIYHIMYSVTRQVPVLYFNVYRGNGCQLPLQEIIFHYGREPRDALLKYISQEDHPILNMPYYVLHPCHTETIMQVLVNLKSCRPISYVASWLHLVSSNVGVPPLEVEWYNQFVIKPFVPSGLSETQTSFHSSCEETETLGGRSPPDSPVEPVPEELLNLSTDSHRPLELSFELEDHKSESESLPQKEQDLPEIPDIS